MTAPRRPKHLALQHIRLPLPGWISILHRASGALLFLALPALLWLWQQSLRSVGTFTELANWLALPPVKLVLIVLWWAFCHHLCAGIRYLLIDLNCISGLTGARRSSRWVLAASLTLTLLGGWRLC